MKKKKKNEKKEEKRRKNEKNEKKLVSDIYILYAVSYCTN